MSKIDCNYFRPATSEPARDINRPPFLSFSRCHSLGLLKFVVKWLFYGRSKFEVFRLFAVRHSLIAGVSENSSLGSQRSFHAAQNH